jgi:glutathione S-transferase
MWEALREMETRLGESDWFGGQAFGAADGYALVFYGWGLNDGYPMDELSQLTVWKDRMLARPSVIHAIRNDAGALHDRLGEGAA